MQIGTNAQMYTDSKLQPISIFKCVYTHVDTHVKEHTHTNAYMHVHTLIHMNTLLCMYTQTYMHIRGNLEDEKGT